MFEAFPLFLLFLCLCCPRVVSGSGVDQAHASVQQAEDSVSQAFEAVLGAESAGGNVSSLIVSLNESAALLSAAENMLRSGDSNGVVALANRSIEIANDVKGEAATLETSASANRNFVFEISLVVSAVGVPVFLVFMFFLWRWFKGYYARKLLGLRPEVVENVES
jgi:hypothetical protein